MECFFPEKFSVRLFMCRWWNPAPKYQIPVPLKQQQSQWRAFSSGVHKDRRKLPIQLAMSNYLGKPPEKGLSLLSITFSLMGAQGNIKTQLECDYIIILKAPSFLSLSGKDHLLPKKKPPVQKREEKDSEKHRANEKTEENGDRKNFISQFRDTFGNWYPYVPGKVIIKPFFRLWINTDLLVRKCNHFYEEKRNC